VKFVELLNELMNEEPALHREFQEAIEKAQTQMRKESNFPPEEVFIVCI